MTKEKRFETCLVLATVLLLLFYVYHLKIFILVAFIVGLIGIFIKPLANGISWLWLKIGDLLGLVIPKIVLTAIFFGFLLPVSLLFRLFKKDPLNLRRNNITYWKLRNYKFTPKDIENIW